MSFQSKRPYFLADIEPTIAVAEAARWERNAVAPPPPPAPTLTSHDLMKQARLARSAYQRELVKHFAEFVMSWFYAPQASRASVKAKSRNSDS
jgi:hypothetical protein